ncbi:sulfotransferase domain-containing protein [Thioclava sp. JE_KL1]|uniref:sulfotransferase domain-containing protein n=1 Tax=Thioclava sp. JE_KL1 TaxID=2651187 RepID=UPI00128BFE1E|nr:sulfotransferase domain-containing protein [Thioclava sp. JE_KL1]MPQ95248.1 sulfotransferase domain-containing protein [Thioclava sp. JE_KL1]
MLNLKKRRNAIASVALRRQLRAERRRSNSFVVVGFPKSGTTWVSQLVAAACGYDFERNDVRLSADNVLLHTHSIQFEGRENLLYVVRDPREVICSAARTLPPARKAEAFEADGRVRPEFAKHVIEAFPGSTTGYANHLSTARVRDWPFVRFEDLKRDPVGTLQKRLTQAAHPASLDDIKAAVDAFDFARLKKVGVRDQFLARSALDSWRDLLSPALQADVARHLGEAAAPFGYDLDPIG